MGYHQDVQVTTGFNDGYYYTKVDDPAQTIDQVFCAGMKYSIAYFFFIPNIQPKLLAMNIRQGGSGQTNSQSMYAIAKSEFVLDSAYQGTYLSAIRNNKKHMFLTLIGGGKK